MVSAHVLFIHLLSLFDIQHNADEITVRIHALTVQWNGLKDIMEFMGAVEMFD